MFFNNIYPIVGILYKNGYCHTLNYIDVFLFTPLMWIFLCRFSLQL